VYVCYLHLLTFSGKQVTGRINGDPFPPFKPSWAEPPSLPPGVRTLPPAKDEPEAGLGKITLQPLIRGRRTCSAFGLLFLGLRDKIFFLQFF